MQNLKSFPLSSKSRHQRNLLWKAAIKLPIYSVAAMPICLATGWTIGAGNSIRFDQLIGFLFASTLLLLWENLTNDIFDSETGVDKLSKPHSVVALIKNKTLLNWIAWIIFILAILIIALLALRSHLAVIILVLISCILGYIYQGPPFRLGYKGFGEPLCWLAFGPFATTASLLVIDPISNTSLGMAWGSALWLGAGPALATTLVLFCSHFHQIEEDAIHGKFSPLVQIGTKNGAKIASLCIYSIFILELIPIIYGFWPVTALLSCLSIPSGLSLMRLIKQYHNNPEKIKNSKFSALRFQTLNGLTLSIGLAISPTLGINLLPLS